MILIEPSFGCFKSRWIPKYNSGAHIYVYWVKTSPTHFKRPFTHTCYIRSSICQPELPTQKSICSCRNHFLLTKKPPKVGRLANTNIQILNLDSRLFAQFSAFKSRFSLSLHFIHTHAASLKMDFSDGSYRCEKYLSD